jgi:cytochrome o ubiquinol oxidase subunit 1
MPRNTSAGLVISVFALVCSFALVWHIWWLAVFGLVASVVAMVVRSYDEDIDYFVPAQEVARIEKARLKDLAEA